MAGNPFFVTIVTRRLEFIAKNEQALENEQDDITWDFSTLKDSVQVMKAKNKRKEYTSEDPMTKASFGNLRDSVSLLKKRVKISEENNKIKLIENNATLNRMSQVSFQEPEKTLPLPVSPPNSASKPILKKSSPTSNQITQPSFDDEAKPTPLPRAIENSSTPESNKNAKIFNNMTFGITGHLNREELEKCISLGGGKVSGVVGKKLSYLLCDQNAFKEDTQRVRKAKKFGVKIVTPDFVYDSTYSKKLQPIEKYILYHGEKQADDDDSYL